MLTILSRISTRMFRSKGEAMRLSITINGLDVFFLCDHKRCHKCFDQCNHTSDINHTAWNGEKTFELIGGRAYFEQADNCRQSGEAEGDREDH